MFVYIIDRDGEFDVYADIDDAEEASKITGLPYVEQVVFESSSGESTRDWSTRDWLAELAAVVQERRAVRGSALRKEAGHDE